MSIRKSWPFTLTIALALAGLPCLPMFAQAYTSIAGDAGDNDPTTFSFRPDNAPCRITDKNGRIFDEKRLLATYGTSQGITILVDGVDVCSPAAAQCRGLVNAKPLKPLIGDLSKPVRIPNGRIGIDPRLGRFKFATGDNDPVKLVGLVHLPNCWCEDVAVNGSIMLVAGDEEEKGLQVFDVSDPKRPTPLGYSGLVSGFADYVAFYKQRYALVSGNTPYLMVYDISEPHRPTLVGAACAGGRNGGPMVPIGDYVYVAAGPLRVISLKDPAHPRVVASVFENKFWRKNCERLDTTS